MIIANPIKTSSFKKQWIDDGPKDKKNYKDKEWTIVRYPEGKLSDIKLKGFPYQANLCAAIINHANSVGKKLQEDVKQIIQKI